MSERDLSTDCHGHNNFVLDDDEIDVDDAAAMAPIRSTGRIESSISPLPRTGDTAQVSPLPAQNSSALYTNSNSQRNVVTASSFISSSPPEIIVREQTLPLTDSLPNGTDEVPSARLEQVVVQSATQTESTAIALNDDSLDASDVPFSQELALSPHTSSASSEDSLLLSDFETLVNNEELHELCPTHYLSNSANHITESGSALCEDIYSRLYHDYDEERFSRGHWEDVDENDRRALSVDVTAEELEAREQTQRNDGLENWTYDSPFSEVSVRIDDVNQTLEPRFLVEANTTLDRVISDIASRIAVDEGADVCTVTLSPLACLKTFITDCLLEKLRYVANRVLHHRKQAPTTKNELLGLVILHVLCASYNESPTTVCDEAESEHFFHMGISAERYHEVWGALCGSKDRRATHDYSSTGWSRTANRATTMITDIESETAAINRELLFVPNATVLSLDDDHLRMASCAVVELTYLQQHDNPKKGLGPVGNALCSTLNPFFLACHFTRTGEKLLHTWERLVQLVQGASTNGALRPMPDAIFAADRGYNSKETIEFLSGVLGASLIGTHKRDLWYPFVFGDGPISKRHRGMAVSERGAHAVYTARLKGSVPGSRTSQVRRTEACVYRESCSGRIAALIHNNSSRFPSRCFTVVCREAFRSTSAIQKLDSLLTVYDGCVAHGERATRTAEGMYSLSNGRKCVEQVLNRITVLTYYQSEDPVWFLLRAFRFTSRTAHGFLTAVAKDYDNRIKGLAWLLQGKCLSPGTEAVQGELFVLIERIKHKWEHVLSTLGIKMTTLPRPSSRRTVAERITTSSPSRINSCTKNELQGTLAVFGRGMEARTTKADLVAAVNQLKEDIADNVVDLEVNAEDEESTEEQRAQNASKPLTNALKEASLTAWVMKPLVAVVPGIPSDGRKAASWQASVFEGGVAEWTGKGMEGREERRKKGGRW